MKKQSLCAIGLVVALTAGVAHAESKWVVGQSAPLSGPNAPFGKAIRDGANAHFQMINKQGGIAGAQIELITEDDHNVRNKAGANTSKLLARNDVVALFGYASATLSLDAIPQAEKAGVLFFAPFSGAKSVRTSSPVVFNLRASYGDELEKMLNLWTSMGFQRIIVVHYNDEVGKQNLDVVAEYLAPQGKKPTAFPLAREATIDDAAFGRLAALRPDVIINTTLFSPTAEIARRMRSAGMVVPISSTSFVGVQQYIDVVGAVGVGMSVAQVVPGPRSPLPIVRECSQALQDAGVTEAMNTTHLEACIGAKVLTEAMRRSKKVGDTKALLAAMRNLGTYDTGGFTVNYSQTQRNGSKFVNIALVSREGKLRF